MRNPMAMVLALILATAASADPRPSTRAWELRPQASTAIAPMTPSAAACLRPLGAAPRPEPKGNCDEFAGTQIIRFFASSVEAMKDSKGRMAVPAGEGVRFAAY